MAQIDIGMAVHAFYEEHSRHPSAQERITMKQRVAAVANTYELADYIRGWAYFYENIYDSEIGG